jgi:hypothetical protein
MEECDFEEAMEPNSSMNYQMPNVGKMKLKLLCVSQLAISREVGCVFSLDRTCID